MWIEVLRREVERRNPQGSVKVAKELGVSRASVDLLLKGTYSADTAKMEERIAMTYGNTGGIKCSVLGEISPALCSEKWKLAKKIGMKAGNPDTLRLYKTCQNCGVRK